MAFTISRATAHPLLADMYRDGYSPNHLVEREW